MIELASQANVHGNLYMYVVLAEGAVSTPASSGGHIDGWTESCHDIVVQCITLYLWFVVIVNSASLISREET